MSEQEYSRKHVDAIIAPWLNFAKKQEEKIDELEAENNIACEHVLELLDKNKALQAFLRRYREETPLGSQPHMIAHEVDKALEQVDG
jgi:hypothetical protein